jgi:hypothetical protein
MSGGIRISEFITWLDTIQAAYGDLEVVVDRDGVRVPIYPKTTEIPKRIHVEPAGEGDEPDSGQVII